MLLLYGSRGKVVMDVHDLGGRGDWVRRRTSDGHGSDLGWREGRWKVAVWQSPT